MIAPLVARPLAPRAHVPAATTAAADPVPLDPPVLEDRIGHAVDAAVAAAFAKAKTPVDDAVAKQQQAFDLMMQWRTEAQRELNAIRDFGLAQQKKENDYLTDFIRMI